MLLDANDRHKDLGNLIDTSCSFHFEDYNNDEMHKKWLWIWIVDIDQQNMSQWQWSGSPQIYLSTNPCTMSPTQWALYIRILFKVSQMCFNKAPCKGLNVPILFPFYTQ